jgi:hypothetical protein
MNITKSLATLALAIATPLSAFAVQGTLTAPSNALTVKYIFQGNSSDYYNPYSLAVGTVPKNTTGCNWFFLSNSANNEEAKLFFQAYLAAKAQRVNMTFTYETTGCTIGSFQLAPN